MKSRTFNYAGKKIKAYYKSAGKGYEVGVCYGSKTLFVGNFIHSAEATAWYGLMGKEIGRVSRKFHGWKAQPTPFHWKFVSNTLYKHYYDYLNRCFDQHTKNYHRQFNQDVKTWKQMKRHPKSAWNSRAVAYTRRAA